MSIGFVAGQHGSCDASQRVGRKADGHWYFLQFVPVPEIYIVDSLGYCSQERGCVSPIPRQCKPQRTYVHECLQPLLRRQTVPPVPKKIEQGNAKIERVQVKSLVTGM